MKKAIMLIPIFISLSIAGCAMNYTQPSSEKIVHQTSLNIDKVMNANVTDVEKSLGSPYYATYYIDADSLKNKNINALSMEDLKSHVSALASYKDNEANNSYLHVYYENGIVKDAFSGPYKMDNLDNAISASNISKANYKVSFFRNRGAICSNDFSVDTAKKDFIGKSITDFNNTDVEKSLGSPYYATYYIDADSLKNKNINALSMEDLKSHVSALASYKDNEANNSYLHVYYENGIVKDAFSGPYKMDNLDNAISASNISKANYKVSFFRNRGAICSNDFSVDTAKKDFIGKSITDFNKYYNVESANFVASTINESETLYFYPLVDHNIIHKDEYKHPNYGSNDNANLSLVNPLNNNISQTNKANSKDLINYYKSAVVLHVKNDKIQSMQIADNQFLYKLVEDVLSSK